MKGKIFVFSLLFSFIFLSGLVVHATGPFTLPFSQPWPISAYFDTDNRMDWVADYIHPSPWPASESWQYGYAYNGHTGTDYDLDSGTRVVAAASGSVETITDDQPNTYPGGPVTYGNYIKINHDNNLDTLYAHLLSDSFRVATSSYTDRGQYIVQSGNSGYSSGDHLHFEVRDTGTGVDPYSDELWTTTSPSFSVYAQQLTKDTGSYISYSGYLSFFQSLGTGFSITGSTSLEISLKGNFSNRDIRIYSCLVSDMSDCINDLNGAEMEYFVSTNSVTATGSQAEYVMTFDNVTITTDRYVFFRYPLITGSTWLTAYGSTDSNSYENGQCIKYYSLTKSESACPSSVQDLYFDLYATEQ
ncbi:MAG: hypothetical protein COV29_01440 [Candidatus Yanofskybacteria bacterium CG10_big_fil_rev_8_21_14_0_10_36_16]|uniref:M23ase beta-sheet core domain-containing protein n=1 Tax=Candidatus Yanofskybacteria bacterium CG10_big_fil_rev_8_21_14_0_10_36_16 TaxID=1975096 RepID=A0A2J0Q7C6_9BACT|nr:MAG: hypothetical protein COV29_01440 [Candidatus Yanofskybacteria bacterium CG10_big_fil_rev_8_21_14_0_10_36_16]